MRQKARNDSAQRQHYIVDRESFIDITSTLLYSGTLRKLQDWEDSPHAHPFLEILFILDGAGTVTLGDTNYPIGKGDIIIYNAGAVHCEHSSTAEPLEASFIAFDKIQLKNLPPNCILSAQSDCIYNVQDAAPVFIRLFNIIKDEISGKDEFYIEIAKDASHALLMYIFRILNQRHQAVELPHKDPVLQSALYYIDQGFLTETGLEEIATKCFVSKYYLSHLFAKHLGMSIGEYIRDKRIGLAKALLAIPELSIGDIAGKCAFNDTNYFARTFKKSTGLTPLQYRRTIKAPK
ncbi:MAG: AraC family transcriptional regulator [Angelakisella sp.]